MQAMLVAGHSARSVIFFFPELQPCNGIRTVIEKNQDVELQFVDMVEQVQVDKNNGRDEGKRRRRRRRALQSRHHKKSKVNM